ncbi:MAG: hypothetical protein E6H06_16000 [Bacteroidetes bacterium]|nr:MAG: hypothetical protein E6H06_16000 [Bacteroidota bacterium]
MKNIFLAFFSMMCLTALSQDKISPVIKQGTKFNYIVHTGGQDYTFSTSLDSVSLGYIKIGWMIEGLGSGGWIMKKNSLEKATHGYWDQPIAGSDVELPDDQNVLILSSAQWESMQKDKKVAFDDQNFLVKIPTDQQLQKLNGKVLDGILLEAENGFRIWILNNSSFPMVLKIEGNPHDINLDLQSID